MKIKIADYAFFSMLVLIIGILAMTFTASGQSTNVINPTTVTITQYQSGRIPLTPTLAASFTSAYLAPMFTAVGYTPLASPALQSRVTIQNYADGSAVITVQYASTLPTAPAGL